jgi:hypothetical protein
MPVLSLRTSGTAWRSVACRDSEKTNRRSLLCPQPDLDHAANDIVRSFDSARSIWNLIPKRTSESRWRKSALTGAPKRCGEMRPNRARRLRWRVFFPIEAQATCADEYDAWFAAASSTTSAPRLAISIYRSPLVTPSSSQLFLLHGWILASAWRQQRRLFSASVDPPVEIRPHVSAALAACGANSDPANSSAPAWVNLT